MESTIDDLIIDMEGARLRLNAAVDQIAPQSEIYPHWQLKQLLDHITGWDELVKTTLLTYQKGEIPARNVKGINHYNDASISARQAFTLEQSRRAYDTARQDVLQTLRKLPSELFNQVFKAPWGGKCTIPWMMKIFIGHEQEHARHLEEILAGK